MFLLNQKIKRGKDLSVQFGIQDKTEKKYEFRCDISLLTQQYEDEDSKGNTFFNTTESIIFTPHDCSQSSLFFDAWLPSAPEQIFEVTAIACSPINKPVRIGLKRRDKHNEKHHLLLMSVEVEDEFKEMLKTSNNTIIISTLKASEEEEYPV